MRKSLLFSLILTFFGVSIANAARIRPRKISKMIQASPVLSKHFTGFALYDLDERKMLVGQNDDKYFTPASNTKLFTFYGGLKLLGDSIAGLQYQEKGDSLIVWGTGDPTFLHPDYPEQRVADFLRITDKKIYLSYGRYQNPFYGVGWTYDDYNEYYQPEIAEFPVYGNVIIFSSSGGNLTTYPQFDRNSPFQLFTPEQPGRFRITRDIQSNVFSRPAGGAPDNFNQQVPFKTGAQTLSQLLKDNIPNFSGIIPYRKPSGFKTVYSVPADTLYKNMMLPSDNFIAEQILLNIAAVKGLEMKTEVVIDFIVKNYLQDLPDKPLWVDGSGLSRQDLFTPRSIVRLCEKIYDDINDEKRLYNMLPNGGKTGTLRNLYKSEVPFVFAKTGSLSNNHNQSGYLRTASGKRLIYSFMNNNFVVPSAEVRAEMERIMTFIHKSY